MAFHRRMLFLSLSSRAKQAECGYSASGALVLTMCKSLLAAKRMRGDSEPSASTAARTSSGSPASCFAKACRGGAGALKASPTNGESVAPTRAGIRHLLKPVWLRRHDVQACASHLVCVTEQSVAVILIDTSGYFI